LNRITAATDNTNNYNVSNISYDKNGNIESLTRNGYQDSSTFTDMDVLDYDYDSGNKLTKVTDGGNGAYGFKDGTNTNDDFEYDINGNLEIDRNKGITSITYNHLNLPDQVNFGSDNIQYVYDATGAKLKRTSSTGTETLYIGNYVYEGGVGNAQLQFFSHPEGYVMPDGQGGYDYVYNYLDHLGSVRLSYTDADGNGSIDPATELIEENNYYPYGLKMLGFNAGVSPHGNSTAKRWKFNGKELDGTLDIDTYDFGARNYDPALGRWMNLDPLAESMRRHSPYNYAFDNPIYYIDPDGMVSLAFDWIKNGDGTYTAQKGDSAKTLSEDAGISLEEADKIVQSQLGENYEGDDGEMKSDVEVDDVVAVPEQVEAFEAEQKSIAEDKKTDSEISKTETEMEASVAAKDKFDKQADSLGKVWLDFMNDPKNSHEKYGNEPSGGMSLWRSYKGGKIEKKQKQKENKSDSVDKVIQKQKQKIERLKNGNNN